MNEKHPRDVRESDDDDGAAGPAASCTSLPIYPRNQLSPQCVSPGCLLGVEINDDAGGHGTKSAGR